MRLLVVSEQMIVYTVTPKNRFDALLDVRDELCGTKCTALGHTAVGSHSECLKCFRPLRGSASGLAVKTENIKSATTSGSIQLRILLNVQSEF